MKKQLSLKYPAVKYRETNGKPVFKNHVKDSNILNKRTQRSDKILFSIVFVIFLLHCLTLIFPVVWMLLSSFKEKIEYVSGNPFALPETWRFINYIQAFGELEVNGTNFGGMLFNSVWYTAISTALTVLMPCVPGYVLSKYRFKGRNFIYTVAITAMVVPIVGATASYMRLMATIGVLDTPLFTVIANLGGFGGAFLVYYGFFKSVSWAYAEAAQMDGGGPFTIFFRIMLPQAVPIMLTYAITNSINYWNTYESVLLYLPSYPTLAAGLFEYKSIAPRGAGGIPVYYAGLIIAMIPAIILFAVFSNRIMSSISIGGLKG